jgi:hypothetical protein
MKKIDILTAALAVIEKKIEPVKIIKKDTSYRRAGGFFGTIPAATEGLIVIETIQRTKHLYTFICLDPIHSELAEKYNSLKQAIAAERRRQGNIFQKKWAAESMAKAAAMVEDDIRTGTIYTNYGKKFIQGDHYIYYAHPYYGLKDYNKTEIMPNTPKHWAHAQMLNQKIEAANTAAIA